MEEHSRLAYLDALGIHQWVAKAPLPYAKPTEYLEIPAVIDGLATFEQKQSAASQVASALDESRQHQPENKEIPNEGVFVQEANVSLEVEPYEVQVHVFGKKDHYLVVVDSAVMQKKPEQELLGNILKALDGLLSTDNVKQITPEKFKWPLFEAHMSANHIDTSKSAAVDSFNAFIYSCQKRYRNSVLICFGSHAASILKTEKMSGELICVESLSDLSASAVLKAKLWRRLCDLKLLKSE